MAAQGERVLLLPRHLKLARQILRGQPHRDVDAGMFLGQRRIGHKFVAAHRHQRHRFHATGDDGLPHPTHNLLRSQGDSLQAAGAETVDRLGRHLHRQTGAQTGDAADIHALLGLRHGATQNHIVDILGVHRGGTLHHSPNHRGGHLLGAGRAQGTTGGFTHSRAGGGNDNSAGHGNVLLFRVLRF